MGIHVHLHDARKRGGNRTGDYGTSEGAKKAAQTRGTGRHVYRGGSSSQSTSKSYTGYGEETGGHRAPRKPPAKASYGYDNKDGSRTYDWFRDGLKSPL